MYTGVVHLVSSNPLHGNTLKKNKPAFFSTNLSLKKKPTLIALSRNAKNDEIAPELNTDSTENLPSKNGRSNSTNSKSVNEDLRKILSKYFPLMQEAVKKNAQKNSRNYGNYVSKPSREKNEDSKMEAFANIMGLFKDLEKQKNAVPKRSDGSVDHERYIKNFFEYDDNLDSENESDSESDSELVETQSDSVPIESDSVPVESVPVKSRPKSSFSKRSPIPEVKYEPILALNGSQKKDKSKSGIYEPVSLDPSDDEEESQELEIPVLENQDLESVEKEEESLDLESMKVAELREIAKARGFKGYSKMKKADLVEMLS